MASTMATITVCNFATAQPSPDQPRARGVLSRYFSSTSAATIYLSDIPDLSDPDTPDAQPPTQVNPTQVYYAPAIPTTVSSPTLCFIPHSHAPLTKPSTPVWRTTISNLTKSYVATHKIPPSSSVILHLCTPDHPPVPITEASAELSTQSTVATTLTITAPPLTTSILASLTKQLADPAFTYATSKSDTTVAYDATTNKFTVNEQATDQAVAPAKAMAPDHAMTPTLLPFPTITPATGAARFFNPDLPSPTASQIPYTAFETAPLPATDDDDYQRSAAPSPSLASSSPTVIRLQVPSQVPPLSFSNAEPSIPDTATIDPDSTIEPNSTIASDPAACVPTLNLLHAFTVAASLLTDRRKTDRLGTMHEENTAEARVAQLALISARFTPHTGRTSMPHTGRTSPHLPSLPLNALPLPSNPPSACNTGRAPLSTRLPLTGRLPLISHGHMSARSAATRVAAPLVSKSVIKLPSQSWPLTTARSTTREFQPNDGAVYRDALRQLGRKCGQAFVGELAGQVVVGGEVREEEVEGIVEFRGRERTEKCGCPKFLVSFGTAYFPVEFAAFIKEHVAESMELIDASRDAACPSIHGDVCTLFRFVLDSSFCSKNKEMGDAFAAVQAALYYPAAETGAVFEAAVANFARLFEREDGVVQRQRMRDVNASSVEERKMWVVDRVAVGVYRAVWAWVVADKVAAHADMVGLDVDGMMQQVVGMFLQICELDRKEGRSEAMHRCGRSAAFQLFRVLDVLLGGAPSMEGIYSVEGGEGGLLDHAESMLEEDTEEVMIETAASVLLNIVRLCRNQGDQAGEEERSTMVKVSNLVARQHRKRGGGSSFVVRGQLTRLQCSIMGVDVGHSTPVATPAPFPASFPAPLLDAMCANMYFDFLKRCKEMRVLENELGPGGGAGGRDVRAELHGLLVSLFRLGGKHELPMHVVGFIAKEVESCVEQRRDREKKEEKERKEKERVEEKERARLEVERKDQERKEMKYELGDRADGKFDINGRDRWFAGVVVGIVGDTYCILFDDGDYKQGVGAEGIKKSRSRKAVPEESLEAVRKGREGLFHEKHKLEEEVEEEEVVAVAEDELGELGGGGHDEEEGEFGGDFDPLEESDTGMFLAIPTTLPMRSGNAPTIGIRSLGKGEGGGGGAKLPRVFSLPNLPVRTSLSVQQTERVEYRYSPFSSFDDELLEAALGVLVRGLTGGGRGGKLFPRLTSVEGGGGAWNPLVALGNVLNVRGGSGCAGLRGVCVGEAEKRLLQMLTPPIHGITAFTPGDDGMLGSYTNLGSGNFGVVKRVGGMAVKVLPRRTSRSDGLGTLHAIFEEISALEKCEGCVGAVQLQTYGLVGEYFWIATEFAEGGSLSKWRQERAEEEVGEKVFLKVWGKVCRAVAELHKRGVVHHDLKSENILLRHLDFDRNDCVCVCDMGEATLKGEGGGVLRARGTECIQSPEVITIVERNRVEGVGYDRRKESEPNEYSDVWQLGCLLFEIVVGDYLFATGGEEGGGFASFYVLLTDDKRGEVFGEEMVQRLGLGGGGGGELVAGVIRSCLQRSPERRPSADDLVRQVASLGERGSC